MFRTFFVWITLASVDASRIQTQVEFSSKSQFGATCEDLENRFHSQVTTFREALEARDSESEFAHSEQALFTMRMYGIVRTLRRARECSWVVENSSDDLDEMRSIIQELLAGNPCGEVARAELQAGAAAETAEEQLRAIPRAMTILMSDDCEASEVQEVDDAAPEAQLQEAEEQLQDSIEDIADAAEDGAAFVEMAQGPRSLRYLRGVAVFFLMIVLLLACAGATFLVVAFLVMAVRTALRLDVASNNFARPLYYAGLGGAIGGALGLAGCAHQLYNQLL